LRIAAKSPQVFGNYRGNDGLRIEDLPELEIDNEHKKITFKVIPIVLFRTC
jgi:hypothetical protein